MTVPNPTSRFAALRVALVHEWLQSLAGSEQTFVRMAEVLPSADLYALTQTPGVDFGLGGRAVRTSVLQRVPIARERRQLTLPLMPLAWKSLRKIPSYDLVVTSSHAFSRYFPGRTAAHFSYVYTPMRYAWVPSIDDRASHWALAPARWSMRKLDRLTVDRVDSFAGISTAVADRISEFYGRDAEVIFPPVDLERLGPNPISRQRDDFLLGFSRWVPYKRLDLVIRIGEQLNLPVVIAGRGPQGGELRRLAAEAKTEVTIVESPTDSELADLYRRCAALVFPAYEDFGIVPVEAQACGAKVVALAAGGSLDTVLDGTTGTLSPTQQLHDFTETTRRCLNLGDRTDDCVRNAARFSVEAFKTRFEEWVQQAA